MSFFDDFEFTSGIREESDFLEKTAKKSSMKFDPTYTQEQMALYVLMRSDHIPLSGFAIGKPEDFVWKFIPNYSLALTNPIKKDWVSWFNGEQDEWKYNHGDEREGHFEKWLKNPYENPIIIIEGTDGKPHIWDGHHRVGISHVAKLKSVPVLFGRRISSIANGQSDVETDAENDTDANSTNYVQDT